MNRNLLLLYYSRGTYPLRDTIRAHLFCWRRYSRYRVMQVNLAYGFPRRLIDQVPLHGVIYHTTMLSTRWHHPTFERVTGLCQPLYNRDAVRIAFPQDEFIYTEALGDFLAAAGVTHVGSCAGPSDWPRIYPGLCRSGVRFHTVLTGYLDDESLRRIERRRPGTVRDMDIGYRAWMPFCSLGEHGMQKAWIAERVGPAARAAGLRTDISLREKDILVGDAWFDFLLRCRATLGVEGGASVLDADGGIRARVEHYLAEHPDATFEQTRSACFPGLDPSLGLACISPRHLEACATRTCQVLLEGRYNGVLEAGQHYVPLRPDYSNLAEVVEVVRDPARTEEIARAAYEHVVTSGRYSYRAFVEEVERTMLNEASPPRGKPSSRVPPSGRMASALLDARDALSWTILRLEAAAPSLVPVQCRARLRPLRRLVLRVAGLST
ncbi:MAG: hypothetical protein HYU36_01500 [Planctomycetes bacterium]|nr:hypothetical protein [Planctomycetota bacterium]